MLTRLSTGVAPPAASGDGSFFQSTDWVAALVETAPPSAGVYWFENAAGAAAIAGVSPRRPAHFGLKTVAFNETGVAAFDRIYPEYNQFTGASAPGACVAALTDFLAAFPDVDEFIFRNSSEAMVEAAIAIDADVAFSAFHVQNTYMIGLDKIRGANGRFTDSVTGTTRARVRQAFSFYVKRAPLSLKIHHASDEGVWAMMIALHEKAWQARGDTGVFVIDELVRFHAALRRRAGERIEFAVISCGDAPIGVLYNFIDGERVLNYQSGFSFESDNKARPGFVAHILAAEHYAQRGFSDYDLLGGGDHYKARFASVGEKLTSFTLTRATPRVRLRRALKQLLRRRNAFAETHPA